MNQICARPARLRLRVGERDLFRQAAQGHHASPRRRCSPGCRRRRRRTTRSSIPKRATIRQRYIIDRMLENGFITAEQHDAAREAGAEVPRAVRSRGARRVRRRGGAPDDLQPVRRRGLHARPERLPDARLGRADARLPRPAQGHHGLRAAPGLSRPGGLHRPARRPERDRRAHRRGAARASRQRRAARRRSSLEASPKKVVAVLQNGEADHRHRRRPEAGDLGAGARRRNPKTQIRPGAVVRLVRGPRATGRSRSCPRSKARSSRSIRAPAPCARWSAASTTRRASSTTSRRPGASRARASSRSSTRRRSRRASRRRRSSTTRRSSSTPAPPAASPGSRRTTTAPSKGPMTMRRGLAKSKNMISIRILQVDRPGVRAAVDHALRLRRRQASGLPDDGARRRLGDAAADGRRPTASSPTAATASIRC